MESHNAVQEEIKEIIKNEGKSLREAARADGRSVQCIWRLLNCSKNPEVKSLRRLLRSNGYDFCIYGGVKYGAATKEKLLADAEEQGVGYYTFLSTLKSVGLRLTITKKV